MPYQNFTHAANLSKSLSSHLAGNWSGEFDHLLQELRTAIVHVNSTQVDVSFAAGLGTWIVNAMNHLKEWAGIGALGILLILVSIVALCCICKMCMKDAMIVQAFVELEAGQSPQAWLTILKE